MLRQQAESAERVAQLEDLLARFAQATRDRFEVTDRRSQETDGKIEAANRRAQETDEKLAALVDAQVRAEDRAAEVDRKFAALAESQQKTEESLRNLAATVARHIAEGHNGRAGASS